MSSFTEDDLKKLNLVPDGKGGYRPKTKEEKEGDTPPEKKHPKSNGISTGYFDGMVLSDILRKYSGGTAGIYIPGNVPSSKNNRGLMRVSKVVKQSPMMVTGTLLPSPQTQDYKKNTKHHWERLAPVFKQMIGIRKPPYTISFFFIHKMRNTWDFVNRSQICLDLMVEHGWLTDDDTTQVIPDFSEGAAYDKNFPGVIIKIK